jgi:hypothetical protein
MVKVKFIGGADEHAAVTELEVGSDGAPPTEVTLGEDTYVTTKQDDDGVWVYLMKPTTTP